MTTPTATASLDAVDPADYRRVLGKVPTSVCVVSAMTPDGPVGVTVGSFTSVSLDPPLIVFYCGASSASAASIASAGRFCVNVLSEGQHDVCSAFAGRAADRFTACSWETGPNGAPRLDGVAAWIDCDVEAVHPAGDHVAILGRVRSLESGPAARPLVFFQGRLVPLDRTRLRSATTEPFAWWNA
ncbi:flavin reductase family protein [Actinocorallia sp. A-T 12471]|uniref:flavin reductase family protein n=1 Tax=Actinocorallia sp. A-T 12471 TaxID=3089813 RepID=UPI0029CB1798|nr:flavin reductase family protein [Actinocorallia sp. A-T 12471]MDX6743961.1 flavin reductase family protein [Actinocorallia sp. A-T 12471]